MNRRGFIGSVVASVVGLFAGGKAVSAQSSGMSLKYTKTGMSRGRTAKFYMCPHQVPDAVNITVTVGVVRHSYYGCHACVGQAVQDNVMAAVVEDSHHSSSVWVGDFSKPGEGFPQFIQD
jgi:hypothetical protein